MKSLRLFVLPLLAGTLLVACGADTSDEPVPTAAGAQDAPAASAVPLPTPEPARSTGEISELLLQLDDLPPGYSVYVDEEEDEDDDESCSDISFDAAGKVSVDYRQSDFGPFITHGVSYYEKSIVAEAAVKAVRELIQGPCREVTDEEGQKFTWSMASFPKIGDESWSANFSVTGGFLPASGRVVVVKKGQFVSVLLSFGLGAGPDAQTMEALARKAAGKLP